MRRGRYSRKPVLTGLAIHTEPLTLCARARHPFFLCYTPDSNNDCNAGKEFWIPRAAASLPCRSSMMSLKPHSHIHRISDSHRLIKLSQNHVLVPGSAAALLAALGRQGVLKASNAPQPSWYITFAALLALCDWVAAAALRNMTALQRPLYRGPHELQIEAPRALTLLVRPQTTRIIHHRS